MSMKPMLRSNICLNAHPQGCKKAVEDQLLADGVTFEQRMENTNNTKVEKFIMSNPELKDRLTDPKQTEAALTKEDKEKYNKKKYLWEEYLYDNSAENLTARDAFVALLNEKGKTAVNNIKYIFLIVLLILLC